MGFKSMPWTLYVKSDGTFVIRQRHTHHQSPFVKAVKEQVAQTKGTDDAPARLAHYDGINAGATHTVIKYVNGERILTLAVELPYFRGGLKKAMLKTIKPPHGDASKTVNRTGEAEEKARGKTLPKEVRPAVSIPPI